MPKKLPHPRASSETYLNQTIRESVSLSPVTEIEIKNLSSAFKGGKATGFDNVSITDGVVDRTHYTRIFQFPPKKQR